MRRIVAALIAAPVLYAFSAFAGDAEIKSAQGTIDAQLKAFQSGDGALAYSYAAPNVKRIFPTVDIFMGMVESGYQPVRKPQELCVRQGAGNERDLDRPAGADRRPRRQGV